VDRRTFVRGAAGAVAGTAVATVGYTWQVEPHWERVEQRDLPVAGLPPLLEGRRLVQLSDIHVGPRVDDDYLVDALERASQLDPDIVVITGDFLTYAQPLVATQYARLGAVLAHVPRGRMATVGILGNHDYGRGWREPDVAEKVVREVERAGVHVLRNETVNVAGLDIIGVDDLWARRADVAGALRGRSSDAAIALCHNPDALDELSWDGYAGWVLAGHTHGGQCKPPFLPPPLLPVRNKRYSAGEVDAGDGRRLYINRGLGHLIQVRFNVRPEITSFRLLRAS
jgi:predicted MPP superfamily phosphohydrolase